VSGTVTFTLGALCLPVMAGLVTMLVLGLVRAQRRDRQRNAAIVGWAAARGWELHRDRPHAPWTDPLPGKGRLDLLLTGALRGRQAAAADYSYTTTSSTGDGSTTTSTHRYQVFVARVRGSYPALAVVSRRTGSKLWRNLTGPGRTETGHAAFDEQYRVVTDSPEVARRLLTPALRHAHIAGRVPDWHLYHQDLLTYQPGRLSPDTIETALTALAHVADLLEPTP
jgi:hypothetical protein